MAMLPHVELLAQLSRLAEESTATTRQGKGSSGGTHTLAIRWPGHGHAATQVVLAKGGVDEATTCPDDAVTVPPAAAAVAVTGESDVGPLWLDDDVVHVRTARHTCSPIVVYGGTVASRTSAAWQLARTALADAAALAYSADDVGACRLVVIDGFDEAVNATTLAAALPSEWPTADDTTVHRALVILHADAPRLLPHWELLLSIVSACPLTTRLLVVDNVDSAPLSTGAGHHQLHYVGAPTHALPTVERAAIKAAVERWDATGLVTSRSAVTTRTMHLRRAAMVLRALTPKAVDAFAICVRAAATMDDHAISVTALSAACQGSWVSGSVDNILSYAREWIDHTLVRVLRGSGANAVYQPTIGVDDLDEVLPAKK